MGLSAFGIPETLVDELSVILLKNGVTVSALPLSESAIREIHYGAFL